MIRHSNGGWGVVTRAELRGRGGACVTHGHGGVEVRTDFKAERVQHPCHACETRDLRSSVDSDCMYAHLAVVDLNWRRRVSLAYAQDGLPSRFSRCFSVLDLVLIVGHIHALQTV